MLTENHVADVHWTEGARAVDLVHLSRQTLGNQDLEREILQLFVTQTEIYFRRLKAAKTNKTWRDAAHTIKGSACGVGAWEIVRYAEKAEKMPPRAGKKAKDYVLKGLDKAIEEARDYIAAVLAEA